MINATATAAATVADIARANLWPSVTGLLGALIGGGAVILGQHLSTKRQEAMQIRSIAADRELKQLEFERLDAGVRRQLVALVGQVSTYIEMVRRHGQVDFGKFRQVLDQMNERIYRWEVPTALNDEQATQLYYASESIELCYRFALDRDYNVLADIPVEAMKRRIENTKLLFRDPCLKLCAFWATMGDVGRQLQFQHLMKTEEEREQEIRDALQHRISSLDEDAAKQ